MNPRTKVPTDADRLPIVAAFEMRDLLDEIAHDEDVGVFRRNEARQAVENFDAALTDESP